VLPWRVSTMRTRRAASGHGNGFTSTFQATLKRTVAAPIPSAIVAVATIAEPGRRRRVRRTKRRFIKILGF
jgi:hypothetical protein